MPAEFMVQLILWVLAAYLVAGFLFALPFVFLWVDRLHEQARGASLFFRLLIFPGSMVLWPYLLVQLKKRKIL